MNFIMRFLSFTILLAFTATIAPMIGFAQTNISSETIEDVPDSYIEEALAQNEKCKNNYTVRQYYNCECRAVAYLDQRIEKGPYISVSEIELLIADQCRDAIGAAGPVYQSCLRRANRFKPGTDPEKYCTCVANNYVSIANEKKPRVNGENLLALDVESHRRCRKPQL